MYEAFHIANLFFLMNECISHASTIDSSEDREFYIISTKWFEKWKNYVNFDYYMQNTEKFLKLNKDQNSEATENFLEELDQPIKLALENYFQNYFLTDNSRLYPGAVSNKELVYDKSINYIDLNDKKSHLNYNVMEYLQMGRDYFIVNKSIWNYFKSIYGGKEIKRFITGKPKNSSIPTDEFLIETKLKNLSLCVIRFKKDEVKLKEKPKFVFFPHKKTIYDFKKHILKIFSFLKDSLMRDLKLWVLDPNYNFESFEEYFLNNYKNNFNPKHGENINFPGNCLDLLDSNTLIEEVDSLITNRIIILEYVDNMNFNHFIFRKQYWTDLPKSVRDVYKTDKIYEKYDYNEKNIKNRSDILSVFNNTTIDGTNNDNKYINLTDTNGMYDTILIKKHSGEDPASTSIAASDTNSLLFKIKKFFLLKYNLSRDSDSDSLNYDELIKEDNRYNPEKILKYDSNIIKTDDLLKQMIDEEFVKETNNLRENINLIMDKNEIMQKFSYAYTNSDRFLHMASNFENSTRKNLNDKKINFRQDMIMKKRERAKYVIGNNNTRNVFHSEIENYCHKDLFEYNEEKESNLCISVKNPENAKIDEESTVERRLENSIAEIGAKEEHGEGYYDEIEEYKEHTLSLIEEKCNYCDKIIEEENDSVFCIKCNKVKYCNTTCKSKDFRFHSKTCL